MTEYDCSCAFLICICPVKELLFIYSLSLTLVILILLFLFPLVFTLPNVFYFMSYELPFLSLFFFFPSSLYQMLTRDQSCHMQHSEYATAICATTKFVLFAICKCLANIFLISLHVIYHWGKEITF